MRVLLKPGVLEKLQKDLDLKEQEFAEYISVSRSHLWRAKLPPSDKRFSLGQDLIAKLLNAFPNKKFEDIFFLEQVSHACDKGEISTA